MMTKPIIFLQAHPVGDLIFKLEGENWGKGLQDTKVTINDQLLCWIQWKDKDDFLNELKDVISKYRI